MISEIKSTEPGYAGKAKAPAELLDIRKVAAMLCCSTRHVNRLADAGKMPAPSRLGALVRWNRAEIERWITEGCPDLAGNKGGRR